MRNCSALRCSVVSLLALSLFGCSADDEGAGRRAGAAPMPSGGANVSDGGFTPPPLPAYPNVPPPPPPPTGSIKIHVEQTGLVLLGDGSRFSKTAVAGEVVTFTDPSITGAQDVTLVSPNEYWDATTLVQVASNEVWIGTNVPTAPTPTPTERVRIKGAVAGNVPDGFYNRVFAFGQTGNGNAPILGSAFDLPVFGPDLPTSLELLALETTTGGTPTRVGFARVAVPPGATPAVPLTKDLAVDHAVTEPVGVEFEGYVSPSYATLELMYNTALTRFVTSTAVSITPLTMLTGIARTAPFDTHACSVHLVAGLSPFHTIDARQSVLKGAASVRLRLPEIAKFVTLISPANTPGYATPPSNIPFANGFPLFEWKPYNAAAQRTHLGITVANVAGKRINWLVMAPPGVTKFQTFKLPLIDVPPPPLTLTNVDVSEAWLSAQGAPTSLVGLESKVVSELMSIDTSVHTYGARFYP